MRKYIVSWFLILFDSLSDKDGYDEGNTKT